MPSIETEHCAPVPLPVKDIMEYYLTFVTAYPAPFVTILNDELDCINWCTSDLQ